MTDRFAEAAAHSERGSHDPHYVENLRRATIASSVGSAFEYYDFALYGLASALIFAKLFFPALGAGLALVASFATFGVGFLARPAGALFFGSVGEKLGRRKVLIMTLSLMGIASTCIGLLPTAATIGVWAPVLLVFLRLCQGFGSGAEQAGSSTLMAEYAPAERRGFFAALPFVGIMAGTVMASGVFALVELAPESVVQGWLWRTPFLLTAVIVPFGVWIRFRMQDSPTFVKLVKQEQNVDKPLKDLMRNSKRNVLVGIGLRMAENGGSYIFQSLAVSFAVMMGVNASVGSLAVVVAALLGILTIPLAGYLSDKIGRVPVYRFGALFMMLLAFPGWYLLSKGNGVLAVVIITLGIAIGDNSMLGPQCSLMPELFGNRRRYIGVAVAREFSAVIAGGVAPVLGAWLLAVTGNAWWSIACYVVVLTGITFVATFFTPETRGRDLTLLEDASKKTETGTVGHATGEVVAA